LIDLPSFAGTASPAVIRERLKRVGVIDIGSNSVRMVVFDGAARSPAYFYNEKVLCGLGRGMRETGRLNPEGRLSAFQAIERFVALGKHMDLTALTAVSTAAVREAHDGSQFVAELEAATGLDVLIATGQQEAMLSAQGVLLGWPDAQGLVCDMGGSSMEMARINKGEITAAQTSMLGPLRLLDMPPEERAPFIQAELDGLRANFQESVERIFLVGGSWRALGRIDMARRNYPLHVLHEYRMSPQNLQETAIWTAGQTPGAMKPLTETSSARLSLLPTAASVIIPLVKTFAPRELAISSYGIREGLLYAHMPASLRKLDPLIEAVKFMERSTSRFPGFGIALYRWLKPIFKGQKRAQGRLLKAACYLHDVTWRAHPDYRAEVCFENVTRANLGGLTHKERVFLGYALLNRYKTSGELRAPLTALQLLNEDERAEALKLGKAMRLGAMLAGGSDALLEKMKLERSDTHLVLRLKSEAAAHSGEVVERRLASLASAFGLEAAIEIKE